MIYKKWFFSIIKLILIFYITLFIVINLIIDPYREYDLFKFEFNKIKISSSYETFPFKLFEKLKSDNYTLVFGTSRSQLISKDLAQANILNFASLYANPIDVFNLIRQFDKNQISNIKEIWYLIDTHTFNAKNSIYETLNLNSKKDFFIQTVSNLNMDKLNNAYSTITSNLKKNYIYYVSEYGETIRVEDKYFNGIIDENQKIRVPITTHKAMKHLSKIDKFCKENNIKITYFTTIYNLPYLKRCNLDLYKAQFQEFLSVIDGFYDFHYVENISINMNLFSNLDHPNAEGTRYLINLVQNSNDKYFITKDNINLHFKNIKFQIQNYDLSNTE